MDKPTTFGQRFWRRPQTTWLRRACFQIHLWTGVALGLYLIAISVSGSAIVFHNEIITNFSRGPARVTIAGTRLTRDQLKQAAVAAWPGYHVTFLWKAKNPEDAVEIWLERGSSTRQRQFDPYSGKDLGPSKPLPVTAVAWFYELHANLLTGPTGRFVNGLISIVVTLLCISGLVVWWPGIARWKRSLLIDWRANWKRLNWDLHNAVGFWVFGFVFIWGVTGVYVSIPIPFNDFVQRISPSPEQTRSVAPATEQSAALLRVSAPVPAKAPQLAVKAAPQLAVKAAPQLAVKAAPQLAAKAAPQAGDEQSTLAAPDSFGPPRARRRQQRILSPGETVLRWFYYLHFGNFAGWKVKTLWVILGLSPLLLVVTGFIMWWNRVLSRDARASRRRAAAKAARRSTAPSTSAA